MRALVQRVSRAAVRVGGEQVAAIGPGLLVLLGVRDGDGEAEADRLADKVRALRIFDDAEGRMNEPLGEREVLCVSQFTLYGGHAQGQPAELRRRGGPRDRRAALRALLRPARRRARGLRRADGGRAGQRRPGHAAARGLSEGVERREHSGRSGARLPGRRRDRRRPHAGERARAALRGRAGRDQARALDSHLRPGAAERRPRRDRDPAAGDDQRRGTLRVERRSARRRSSTRMHEVQAILSCVGAGGRLAAPRCRSSTRSSSVAPAAEQRPATPRRTRSPPSSAAASTRLDRARHPEITHLIHVVGLRRPARGRRASAPRSRERSPRRRSWLGKSLITVETNLRELADRH